MRVLLLLPCFFLLSCVADTAPPSDGLLSIGTHRLQIRCEGHGSPTVVLDSGIADDMERLAPLRLRLAEATHVCTYDRAGYGRSEAGPLPRDSGREAEELKALLDAASIPGPYVVVGHSLGALNVQIFAARYVKDVAGIVLLDPPPLSFIRGEAYTKLLAMAEQMTAEWETMGQSDEPGAAFFKMIASEHREMFGESARLASVISSFGETPLLVVAAGRPNPAFGDIAEEYQRYWIEQSRALSRKSSKGRFVLLEDSSHHLYVDALDPTVEQILSIVRRAKGG